MDPRVALLREFYRGLPQDRVKLETDEHGFDFLERLVAGGAVLEYGELTLSGLLHKYKLARLPAGEFDGHLAAHVAQTRNVCLYFGEQANALFCFNLDDNRLPAAGTPLPEMEFAVRHLGETLRQVGCEPLIVASGRGYHVWGRLEEAVPNDRLYAFLLRAGVLTAAALQRGGLDHHRIKFNFYPDPRARDVVSLRLFGTRHARTRRFSQVLADGGLLDEAASWEHFAGHLRTGTIPAARLLAAQEALAAMA
jgi:hypothetical protein